MKKITIKEHREILKKQLKEVNRLYQNDPYKITIKNLDLLFSVIHKQKKESVKINDLYANEQFSLSRLSTTCIGCIALSVHSDYSEEDKSRLLPNDSEQNPDPNLILQSQLIQIANYSYSIIELCMQGLDSPARSLIRVLSELIHQTLITMSSKEDMTTFVNAREEDATKTWYELFSTKKIKKKMSLIDHKLGFDSELINEMKQMRKRNLTFYSENVHHSYAATTIGARASRYKQNDYPLCFLGGENSMVQSTLRTLNDEIWLFLTYFFVIQNKLLQRTPQNLNDKSLWLEALSLHSTISIIHKNSKQ